MWSIYGERITAETRLLTFTNFKPSIQHFRPCLNQFESNLIQHSNITNVIVCTCIALLRTGRCRLHRPGNNSLSADTV